MCVEKRPKKQQFAQTSLLSNADTKAIRAVKFVHSKVRLDPVTPHQTQGKTQL